MDWQKVSSIQNRVHYWDISGTDAQMMKHRQKIEIYKAICRDNTHTRGSLIPLLNYRNTTVSNLVQELVDDGLIQNGESRAGKRRGRPDYYLLPRFNKFTAISVSVNDRNLSFSLVNINGDILGEQKVKIPLSSNNEEFLYIFKQNILELIKANPVESTLLGIEVLLVGTVDRENLTWVDVYRWPNLKNLSFKEFSRELNLPIDLRRVMDAELQFLLEQDREKSRNSTLLFMWGFGIGAAYSYKGNILESSYGRFTDVGHTVISADSKKLCRCGQYGCVETEAAIYAILPALVKLHPDLHEESDEIQNFLKTATMQDLESIHYAIEVVGLCLSNLFKTLFPRRIYLTGPFFQNEIIMQRILKIMESAVSRHQGDVEFHLIEDGFTGAQWGGLLSLFRNKLKGILKS